jgi:hypothetical protein
MSAISYKKQAWLAERKRYTWFLRENEFDRSQWWKGKDDSEIEPIAALYEIARRHPKVGDLRRKVPLADWFGERIQHPQIFTHKSECEMIDQVNAVIAGESAALSCLCFVGMKSWSSLTQRAKDHWESNAGGIKGVKCRDDSQRFVSITEDVLLDILAKYANSIGTKGKKGYPLGANWWELVDKRIAKNPPTEDEIESAIVRSAVTAHRKGHLLISIDPGIEVEEALKLLAQKIKEHRERIGKVKQHPRSANWLPLIEKFEKAACSPKLESSEFIPYRRAMDRIHFDVSFNSSDYARSLIKLAGQSWGINTLGIKLLTSLTTITGTKSTVD